MKKIFFILILIYLFTCCNRARPQIAKNIDMEDGHFASWEKVPSLIESISITNFRAPLSELHNLTRIKLGYPQVALCLNESDHKDYMLQTKQNWLQWWNSTGKLVEKQKKEHSSIDPKAFKIAWDFLGINASQPPKIAPVWIPEKWTLYITYTNGDYLGRVHEIWVINRQDTSATLSKLTGSYYQTENLQVGGGWNVNLQVHKNFSTKQADQTLIALCYLHLYAPDSHIVPPENSLSGYYPHATLHLWGNQNQILWNTEGYNFTKNRPKNGDGESGRSYYFLKSFFSNKTNWENASNPTNRMLEPYRTFLSLNKPHFCHVASDIITFFAEKGGKLEKQAILEWIEKQKIACNPNMSWIECSHSFGTSSKINVLNSTRYQIQQSIKNFKRIATRLNSHDDSAQKLEQYGSELTRLIANEKEMEIQSYPEPLRTLIRADNHPNDSDLKHLSLAVQQIRDQPNPILFNQLIKEIHEGTLKMQSLLENILINEHKCLTLKPWGDKEESIAINACIDALPLAKKGSQDELITLLLRSFGGGHIEYQGENGGRSIRVTFTPNGRTESYDGASNPLSITDAQKELRRLYSQKKK